MFSRNDPVIYIVIIYVVIVLDFLFLARTWRRGVGVAVVQNTLPPIQRCTCTELARNCSFVVCLSSLDEDHHRAAGRRSTQHGRSTPDIHSRPVWFYVQWYSMDAAGSMIDRADMVYFYRF